MKRTEKIKKNVKGITLIALVVTIIVLLILAGIAVNLTVGNNGIFTRAETSTLESRAATVDEAKMMWEADKIASRYETSGKALTLEEFLEDLQNKKLITLKEREEIENTGKVKIGSREIVFDKETEIIDYDKYSLLCPTGNTTDGGVTFETDNLGIILFRKSAGKREFLEVVFKEEFDKELSASKEEISDEELFVTLLNADAEIKYNSFKELIEEAYNAGNISKKYETFEELCVDAPDYLGIVNNYRIDSILANWDFTIYNPDGTQYEGGYMVPFQTQDCIFTAKLNGKEKKLKISIKQYENVSYTYFYDTRLIAMDIVNKERLKINSAEITKYNNQEKIDIQLVDDEINGLNYIPFYGPERTFYKIKTETDKAVLENYFLYYDLMNG